MIKELIDTVRGREGYAGVAIYRGDTLLFCESLELSFAEKIKILFAENEAVYHSKVTAVMIRGFTITASMIDDLLVISRLEGRFMPAPVVTQEEPEYDVKGPEVRLITREEARKEAEIMLKHLIKTS